MHTEFSFFKGFEFNADVHALNIDGTAAPKGRWVIIGTLLALLYGLFICVSTLADIYYVKFQHPWLAKLCADHGWKPIMGVDDAGEATGETVDFFTKTEIAAVKYSGGRFVDHASNVDFDRFWSKSIVRGGIATDVTDLDAMQRNGLGYYFTGAAMIVGLILCGYGQACADTQSKVLQKLLEKEVNDELADKEHEKQTVKQHYNNVEYFVNHLTGNTGGSTGNDTDEPRTEATLSPNSPYGANSHLDLDGDGVADFDDESGTESDHGTF